MARVPNESPDAVLVIGLGRFGSAIAVTLDKLGRDVLAVESDPDLANSGHIGSVLLKPMHAQLKPCISLERKIFKLRLSVLVPH